MCCFVFTLASPAHEWDHPPATVKHEQPSRKAWADVVSASVNKKENASVIDRLGKPVHKLT